MHIYLSMYMYNIYVCVDTCTCIYMSVLHLICMYTMYMHIRLLRVNVFPVWIIAILVESDKCQSNHNIGRPLAEIIQTIFVGKFLPFFLAMTYPWKTGSV